MVQHTGGKIVKPNGNEREKCECQCKKKKEITLFVFQGCISQNTFELEVYKAFQTSTQLPPTLKMLDSFNSIICQGLASKWMYEEEFTQVPPFTEVSSTINKTCSIICTRLSFQSE